MRTLQNLKLIAAAGPLVEDSVPLIRLLVLSAFAAFVSCVPVFGQSPTAQTSGIYLTASDYKEGRLSFEDDCKSKTHKLAVHDTLNRPYIDITHASEKHRYAKRDVFGFHACDGRDYRFGTNHEYQILESKELYIYARSVPQSYGKGFRTVTEYYFSAGPDAEVQALTLENLERTWPQNERFHDSLDAAFGAGQNVAQYDNFHKMFKVNRMLIAAREQQP